MVLQKKIRNQVHFSMKKTIAILLAALMLLSLAACAAKDGAPKSDGEQTAAGAVSGEMYDAGQVSVLIPDGWNAVPQHDVFADDANAMLPDVINVCKGGTTADDLYSHPYVRIDFGGTSKTLMMASKSYYEDAEDIEPLTTGSHSWNGFKCSNYGTPMTVLFCEETPIQYQACVFTDTAGGKLSLEDADVQAILASVCPSDEADAAAAGTQQPAEPAQDGASDPSSLYARYRGDWHGMVGFRSCSGKWEAVNGEEYPAIARFKVGDEGAIHPFIGVYVEDAPFEHLIAEWDEASGGMRLRGTWKRADFENALVTEQDGTLHVEIPLQRDDAAMTMVLNFRRLDDTGWTDENPRLTETTIEKCKGMSFDDLADMFGISFADYPSEDKG